MRVLLNILVLVLAIGIQTLNAQPSSEYTILDSLKHVKDTTTNDSIKFQIYKNISNINVDIDTLEKYSLEYLGYAQHVGSQQNVIIAEYILGRQNMLKSNWDKAIEWSLKCQNLADSTNDKKFRGFARTQLAAIFANTNDLNSMMAVSNEALEISEETKDSASLIWANYMIGALYNQIYMFDNAELFFQKGLDIALESNDNYSEANLRQAIASNMVQRYQHNDVLKNELQTLFKARDVVYQNIFDNSISIMFQINSVGTLCETYKEIYQITKNPIDLDSAEYFLNIGREKIRRYNVRMYDNMYDALEIYISSLKGDYKKAYSVVRKFKDLGNVAENEVDGIEVLEAIIFYYQKTKDYKNLVEMMRCQKLARYRKFSLEFCVSQTNNDMQHSYNQIMKEEEKKIKDKEFQMDIEQKRAKVFDIFLSILFVIACCFVIFYIVKFIIHSHTNLKLKKQSKELFKQNDELQVLQSEIKDYNDKIEEQKEAITEQNTILMETYSSQQKSMEFARRIQLAIMHDEDFVTEIFNDNFVYFNPKEAVSGDFYWAKEIGGRKLLAVGDCTGHGVPGGMLSMLGISSINMIVNQNPDFTPADILENLKTKFFNTINDSSNDTNVDDGMDIVLICIEGDRLTFASAGRPLLMIRDKAATIFRGDRRTIGNGISAVEKFRNQEIQITKGDMFYLFSDGITDQFGGTETKSKYSIKRLQQLLVEISGYPLYAQREAIIHTITQWMQKSDSKKYPQIDDQLIIGVKC